MSHQNVVALLFVMLLIVALPASGYAQGAAPANDDLKTGKYEGTAEGAEVGSMPVTFRLTNEGGKITGAVEAPQGVLPITSGTYEGGKLKLKIDVSGDEGLVTGEHKDGRITGNWSVNNAQGKFDVKIAKDAPAASPAADRISGEWDAVASAGSNQYPFTLRLKLEGESVTGETHGERGNGPIKGSWAGEQLTLNITIPDGTVVLKAKLREGKLVGDFDYAGQVQGTWEAKKKN